MFISRVFYNRSELVALFELILKIVSYTSGEWSDEFRRCKEKIIQILADLRFHSICESVLFFAFESGVANDSSSRVSPLFMSVFLLSALDMKHPRKDMIKKILLSSCNDAESVNHARDDWCDMRGRELNVSQYTVAQMLTRP
jgi:hypothetical protein